MILCFSAGGTGVHSLFSVRVPKVMRLSLPDLDVRLRLYSEAVTVIRETTLPPVRE